MKPYIKFTETLQIVGSGWLKYRETELSYPLRAEETT